MSLSVNTVVLHRLSTCREISTQLMVLGHTSARLWQVHVCQCSSAFTEPHTHIELLCAVPLSSSTNFHRICRDHDHHSSLGVDLHRMSRRTRSLELSPRRLLFAKDSLALKQISHHASYGQCVVVRPLLLCRIVGFCWLFRGFLVGLVRFSVSRVRLLLCSFAT